MVPVLFQGILDSCKERTLWFHDGMLFETKRKVQHKDMQWFQIDSHISLPDYIVTQYLQCSSCMSVYI